MEFSVPVYPCIALEIFDDNSHHQAQQKALYDAPRWVTGSYATTFEMDSLRFKNATS